MKLTRNQLILNAVLCLTLLAVIIWAIYAEYDRPWKKYQKERIQQIYLQDLGEADRCITCHQGMDKPGFSNRPQPFRSHSGDYLKHHKVEKFGCVACHEGQGAALTIDDAHGDVKNWTRPVLKRPFAQASCGKCHSLNNGLPLTVELQGASVFIEGWKLFNEYNCIGCHKLKGYERPERIGSILDPVGSKAKRDWLILWLKNPKDYLDKTKMPVFKLTDDEAGCIVDYLLSLSPSPPPSTVKGERQGEGKFEKGDSVEGKNLVNTLGCLGCHAVDDKGNEFAPDLSDIGNKVKPDWLFQFLKKPTASQPKTTMPIPAISEDEIQDVTAYLMSLKKKGRGKRDVIPPKPEIKKKALDSPVKPENDILIRTTFNKKTKYFSENINKGKKLVKDKGCAGCHEVAKRPEGYDAPPLDGIGSKKVDELFWGNITDTGKTLADWLLIKVMNPEKFSTDKVVTRMPNYKFNEQQAKALVTFLLSLREDIVPVKYTKTLIASDAPGMKGKKVFEKYNCLGCHKINKEGGDTGPDLTKEAKKSRPEWLSSFLKSPYKIRPAPMLKARMPDFKLSEEEINNVIEYLASLSGIPYPYPFELKKEVQPEDIADGEKLYHEIFACSGCHQIDGKGGQIGPDHTDVASRLTKEWIERWLKDPQSIQSDVRMPKFQFKDWEFEALNDYLLTLGKYRFIHVKKKD